MMLAENRRPGSRKRPSSDGDASVPPNAARGLPAATAAPARRSTALAQPTPPPHGGRAARAASQALLSVRQVVAPLSLRRLTQTMAHAVATGTASSSKWRIDPLPRCPPSRRVPPPALDFHRSSVVGSADCVPPYGCCSSEAGTRSAVRLALLRRGKAGAAAVPLRRATVASGGLPRDLEGPALYARWTLRDGLALRVAPAVRASRPSFRGG
jgi:hypothetical protein